MGLDRKVGGASQRIREVILFPDILGVRRRQVSSERERLPLVLDGRRQVMFIQVIASELAVIERQIHLGGLVPGAAGRRSCPAKIEDDGMGPGAGLR